MSPGSFCPPRAGSILDHIGNTPLVRLNRVPATLGVKATVYAKVEFFNSGGSVKDRVAKRMIEKAEEEGRIKPGDTLIEPSSGNTGIALALIAAVKGYRCIITLPQKTSLEKERIIVALGAQVVRTPADLPPESPESWFGVARRLNGEIPNSFILGQSTNPENPRAHEVTTAEEVWDQTRGAVDVFIAGAGTGGTLTGTARGLRKHNPDLFVVGADPVGSVLAQPASLNQVRGPNKIEGIGLEFVPAVLERDAADLWIKVSDEECFRYARMLVKEEGILCGGSSGAPLAALGKLMVQRPELNREDRVVVVVLPDSFNNYLTTFADDRWMAANGFSVNTTTTIKSRL